ncbi:LysR substrate-binding domain-containing protein [Vogesella sp. LIG4]|uniref:LysR substrate-binding domain-containing protein n=1 Tax=Vogesella sp. LIG4 TaxID=1192162 RepID=UPI00081F97F4|nr:LysR substrate-binding domain-containing protein [Vogesella sp. LIG4]SCK31024.1 LysR family transcriptional regulator, glycine cleavage system transcriptional activator [Vogesella sp. LIG4]
MPRKTPPLYALSVFEAAARHQSFTRAANELCLTQGAVSKQVAQLEAHLGYPLFHRYARSLRLSAQGELLLSYVQRGFQVLEQGMDAAAALTTQLRIKAPSCVVRWLLPALRDFAGQAPDIPVQLAGVHDHSVNFAQEDVDLAIVYKPRTALADNEQLLFTEELTPVLAPRLLQQLGLPLQREADLAHFPLLHPSHDKRDWRQWLAWRGAGTVDYRGGTVFDTLDQAMNAALQGYGITLGDITLLAPELAAGELLAPFSPPWRSGYAFALACKPDEARPAVHAVRDWLLARCGEHATTAAT